MDLTNRKIIQQLKENSKISLESIGKNVNLSTPSVRDRINKLKDIGVIKRYTIDVDYTILGYAIDVIIEITIKNNLYQDFKTFIAQQNNVDCCYRVSGDSCFMFKVRFKHMPEVESFIDTLQTYGHTQTHFIFSKII